MSPDISPPFSSLEAIRYGWNTTKENLKPLLILCVAALFLAMVNGALQRHGNGLLGPATEILQAAAVALARAAVGLAFLRSALKLHDGKPVDVFQLGELLAGFVTYLLTQILCALIVIGGLILLVVPGVIWGLKFSMSGFLVADGATSPTDALRESSRLTQGVKWQLFVLTLLMLGLNLLGALALGIGLFLTIPTTVLAWAHVFRRLQARATALPGPAPQAEAAAPIVTGP